MKLRLLNASHQALCYFGYLAGYRLVHEVGPGPAVRPLPAGLHGSRGHAHPVPGPGIDLDAYKHQLIERFSNAAGPRHRRPAVRGKLRPDPEMAAPGRPGETSPPGREVTLSAAVVASWARYAEGVDEQGEPIEVVDRLADKLIRPPRRQRSDPLAFVADRELFGDLVDDERFTKPYLAALDSLHRLRRPRHGAGPRRQVHSMKIMSGGVRVVRVPWEAPLNVGAAMEA